jgi:hypothetical protein
MCLTGLTSRRRPGWVRDRRPSLFRGCGARAVREWVAQCHGVETGLTAQCHTVAGMASPGGLAEQRRDMIPRRCQRHGADSSLTWAPACVRTLNAPVGEPQVRRSLTQGGVWPSSEAKPRPRGRPALERGGASPEGAPSPQAMRSFVSRFARGWLGLMSVF